MTALSAALAQRAAYPNEAWCMAKGVMGTDIIYQGGLVSSVTTDGLLLAGQDTANHKFRGVAVETVDNSAAATGVTAALWTEGIFTFAASAATEAVVGQTAYIVDDATVAISGTSNAVKCGTIVEYVDASTVRVKINVHW